MTPARKSSLCETTSASAGSSRRVGIKYRDQRIGLAFSLSNCDLGKPQPRIIANNADSVTITLLLTHHFTKVLKMRIALASDHAGYAEKERLKGLLTELGVEFDDLGTGSEESVDYPDYARKVAEQVAKGQVEQGVLVCGSGTRMAIHCDKVPRVR